MEFTIKTRETGIPTQQARQTGALWTDTSVNDRWSLLLKLEKLGFQLSKQGRQELPGLITSVSDRWKLLLKLDKIGFQPSKQGRQELPGLILQSMADETYY